MKWPFTRYSSRDNIGLYINNQTHWVVFIMCAKCLLCYFKKLIMNINLYITIYITIYIHNILFFKKLCNHWLVSTPHNVIESNNTKCYKIKTCINWNEKEFFILNKKTLSLQPRNKLMSFFIVAFHGQQTLGLIVCSEDTCWVVLAWCVFLLAEYVSMYRRTITIELDIKGFTIIQKRGIHR